MNIALFAISTFIVIICIGIPVATHPRWFKTYEEKIHSAKDKGYCAMATPVKIQDKPYNLPIRATTIPSHINLSLKAGYIQSAANRMTTRSQGCSIFRAGTQKEHFAAGKTSP